MPRPDKKTLIDAIVGAATQGEFSGDERDGVAELISPENFSYEALRRTARAYREQLSRLSYGVLVGNYETAAALDAAAWRTFHEGEAHLGQEERDAKVEAFRRQQAERGRRHGLQPEIIQAACHLRARGLSAREAWDEIQKTPFTTTSNATVRIDEPKSQRLGQKIYVVLPNGRAKRPIVFNTWRQRYWPAS